MSIHRSLTAALALLITGCGALTRTDYDRPPLPLPTAWQQRDTGTAFLTHTAHWWDLSLIHI